MVIQTSGGTLSTMTKKNKGNMGRKSEEEGILEGQLVPEQDAIFLIINFDLYGFYVEPGYGNK